MTDEQHEHEDVTEEEIERQEGQPLPDREAMSLVTPGTDPVVFPFVDPADGTEWTNDPVPQD